MTTEKHKSLLFPFIFFAPQEQQKKYCNGKEFHSEKWFQNDVEDFSFSGILFRDNKVYVINIEILCADNDYQPMYLEITEIFNKLLQEFTIYHLCIMISAVLRKKFYKESSLAQKLRLNIKYDNEYKLPKFKYSIERHHSRHRKFYCSTESEGKQFWDRIIDNAIHEINNVASFRQSFYKGLPTLFTDYQSVPNFDISKNSYQRPENIREGKSRKLRRGFFAFSNKGG